MKSICRLSNTLRLVKPKGEMAGQWGDPIEIIDQAKKIFTFHIQFNNSGSSYY